MICLSRRDEWQIKGLVAPREYGDDCVECDIRNEFETVNGMPVYYGVDLCDSDDSEWDDPWDLAYREHVERYNFDALDDMELKVFERLKAVNEPTMMVSEMPGRGPIRQELHVPQVEADRLDSAGMGDLLTEGSDIGYIAESPIHRSSVMPHDGVSAFYYDGDLGDSDCGSVEDRERDTWDDWCDSAFHNGYGDFFPDDAGAYPPVVFSDPLLWENDIAESSHFLLDVGQVPVSTSPILVGTIVPLEFPDSDCTARWDDDVLEVLDRLFSKFSVLPRGMEDKFRNMSVLEGDALHTCASYI